MQPATARLPGAGIPFSLHNKFGNSQSIFAFFLICVIVCVIIQAKETDLEGSEMKGYKKTEYSFFTGITNSGATWRKVWEKDGRYFVKSNGRIADVTDKRNYWHKF